MSANLNNVLPNGSKGSCSVDILPIGHLRDIWNDQWLAVDKLIQEIFLKGLEVVGNVLAFSYGEGVVAVGKDSGRKLLLIDEEVAAMDVCNGNLVFSPQELAASVRNNGKLIVSLTCTQVRSWSTSCIASFPGHRKNSLATSVSLNSYFCCQKVGSTNQISEWYHMTTVNHALNCHSHAHSSLITIAWSC